MTPDEYEKAAVIAREAGQEMLARLPFMTIKPNTIANMGPAASLIHLPLQEQYPDATIVTLSDTQSISPQSVDMIVANLYLPWHTDFTAVLREWRRALRPDGLLMFTALGPDTLKEWHGQLNAKEVPQFVDMHDLGDMLLQEGFAEPVVDVNYYTTSYQDKNRFIQELCASALWFPEQIHDHFSATSMGTWDTTYEVVFGHAFAPAESDTHTPSQDGVVRIPVSALRKKRLLAK